MLFEMTLAVLVAAAAAISLTFLLEGRAPARRNTRTRAVVGFSLPLLLVGWSSGVLLTPSGPQSWAAIWLAIGLVGLTIALFLAIVAPPRGPSKRELQRAERRSRPLDHAFLLYSFGMSLAVLTAIVTRDVWVS